MTTPAGILLLGTGAFAARIAFDLAAAAQNPVEVVIAGRNGPRLDWLRTAGMLVRRSSATLSQRPPHTLAERCAGE